MSKQKALAKELYELWLNGGRNHVFKAIKRRQNKRIITLVAEIVRNLQVDKYQLESFICDIKFCLEPTEATGFIEVAQRDWREGYYDALFKNFSAKAKENIILGTATLLKYMESNEIDSFIEKAKEHERE